MAPSDTNRVQFRAPDYHADGSFRTAEYAIEGSTDGGWAITANGQPYLELGPGYRLLDTVECGICSTDLARRLLPFPLPQVTGHELIATDAAGRRHVVEINASHEARGVEHACPFCSAGLPTHCPDRLVLGIDRLPGGFGPHVLVPVHAALPIPDELPSSSAVLIEPFAAALHAVATIRPNAGETVAVLGPRRLGALVVAALAAHRSSQACDFEILALSRHQPLLDLARSLGADRGILFAGDGTELDGGLADVVVDTTGSPSGLELAVRLARREVHLKSTHGQEAGGVRHLTELVVDELSIARWSAERIEDVATIAWLAAEPPPRELTQRTRVLSSTTAGAALDEVTKQPSGSGLPRADAVVVDTADQIAAAIRPRPDSAASLVRPRGTIYVHSGAGATGTSLLVDAVVQRDLRLTSSRCGDFRRALELMASVPQLQQLGERFITHRFAAATIADAFAVAGSPACIKAVLRHGPAEDDDVAG